MSQPTTSGILDVLIKAGSYQQIATDLGVSYQAVQQWVKQGYVPVRRITEIETLYGIPRTRLINPKYTSPLAAPRFDDLNDGE